MHIIFTDFLFLLGMYNTYEYEYVCTILVCTYVRMYGYVRTSTYNVCMSYIHPLEYAQYLFLLHSSFLCPPPLHACMYVCIYMYVYMCICSCECVCSVCVHINVNYIHTDVCILVKEDLHACI